MLVLNRPPLLHWLGDKVTDALHRYFDLIEAGRIAATDKPFAARSKCRSGNTRHLLLLEQPERKLAARQPSAGDVWEDIECAVRQEAGQSKVIERAHDIVP